MVCSNISDLKIVRVLNSSVIKILKPFFTEDAKLSKDLMAEELEYEMTEAPEAINVLVAIRDSHIVGFIIGYIPTDRFYVWIEQAYTENGCGKEVGLKLLEALKLWALDLDISELRFQTLRSSTAFARAWGFEEYCVVMKQNF